MTNTTHAPIPTSITVAEGFTVRIIDNYAGDHDVAVKPGRYDLVPEYRIERAEWTASGQDERRLRGVYALLPIIEEARTVATVLYFGKALASKVRPAHEDTYTFSIAAYLLDSFDRKHLTLNY